MPTLPKCARCASEARFGGLVAEIIPGLVLCDHCTADVNHYLRTAHRDTAHSAITRRVREYREAHPLPVSEETPPSID